MTTQAEIEAFVNRNYRWNFTTNLLETGLCLFGRGFVSFGAFIPVFLSFFTDSKVLIGLVGTLFPIGGLLPQLLTAPLTESLSQKKWLVVGLSTLEKISYLILAGLAFWSLKMDPRVLIGLLLFMCFMMGVFGGIVQTGWSELMAEIFPPHKRGRYFGTAFFVGGALGALGAYLGGIILSKYPMPTNYAASFFVGFLIIIFSWTFLLWIKEPPPTHAPVRRDFNPAYFRELKEIMRQDKNFSFFVIVQSVLTMASMAGVFTVVYVQQKFNMGGYQVGILATYLMIGGTFGTLICGWLGDHFGHRKIVGICIGIRVVGYILILLAANPIILYASVLILGLGNNGVGINITPMVYELAPVQRRPTYIGLSSSIFGLVAMLTPLTAGLVAQAVGYNGLFVITIVAVFCTMFLHFFLIKEPSENLHAVHSQPGGSESPVQ